MQGRLCISSLNTGSATSKKSWKTLPFLVQLANALPTGTLNIYQEVTANSTRMFRRRKVGSSLAVLLARSCAYVFVVGGGGARNDGKGSNCKLVVRDQEHARSFEMRVTSGGERMGVTGDGIQSVEALRAKRVQLKIDVKKNGKRTVEWRAPSALLIRATFEGRPYTVMAPHFVRGLCGQKPRAMEQARWVSKWIKKYNPDVVVGDMNCSVEQLRAAVPSLRDNGKWRSATSGGAENHSTPKTKNAKGPIDHIIFRTSVFKLVNGTVHNDLDVPKLRDKSAIDHYPISATFRFRRFRCLPPRFRISTSHDFP